MAENAVWTVASHLHDMPPESVALYREFERAVLACGPVEISPSKTTITFKGSRRGFAGARPTRRGARGYLDLTRAIADDPRIISSSPYTKRLYVNQYRLTDVSDLDDTFLALIREAYLVGQGEHLQ